MLPPAKLTATFADTFAVLYAAGCLNIAIPEPPAPPVASNPGGPPPLAPPPPPPVFTLAAVPAWFVDSLGYCPYPPGPPPP